MTPGKLRVQPRFPQFRIISGSAGCQSTLSETFYLDDVLPAGAYFIRQNNTARTLPACKQNILVSTLTYSFAPGVALVLLNLSLGINLGIDI